MKDKIISCARTGSDDEKITTAKINDYQIESGVLEASQIPMGNLTSLNITTEDKKTE